MIFAGIAAVAAAVLTATRAGSARGEARPLVIEAQDPAAAGVDAITVDNPPARRATGRRVAAAALGLACISVSSIAVLVLVFSFARAAPLSASAMAPSRDRPGS